MTESPSQGKINERQDPDQDLVERVLAGEGDAFTPLLLKYQGKILNFLYRMSGDREMAEDLAQEVFLKAYEGLPRFRKEATFSTWLYRIAHNHGLNVLKGKRREIAETALAYHPSNHNPFTMLADPSTSAEQRLQQRELQAVIQERLAELTPEHRAALVLRDIQGLTYEQIASALDLEMGTVRSRIHRARMELKERLRSYLET